MTKSIAENPESVGTHASGYAKGEKDAQAGTKDITELTKIAPIKAAKSTANAGNINTAKIEPKGQVKNIAVNNNQELKDASAKFKAEKSSTKRKPKL